MNCALLHCQGCTSKDALPCLPCLATSALLRCCTGEPKGVLLKHSAVMAAVSTLTYFTEVCLRNDKWLPTCSLKPCLGMGTCPACCNRQHNVGAAIAPLLLQLCWPSISLSLRFCRVRSLSSRPLIVCCPICLWRTSLTGEYEVPAKSLSCCFYLGSSVLLFCCLCSG